MISRWPGTVTWVSSAKGQTNTCTSSSGRCRLAASAAAHHTARREASDRSKPATTQSRPDSGMRTDLPVQLINTRAVPSPRQEESLIPARDR